MKTVSRPLLDSLKMRVKPIFKTWVIQEVFAEIFAAKIESKVRREMMSESFSTSSAVRTAQSEFDSSPAHLAFLMSHLTPAPKAPPRQTYTAGPRPTPKPHVLNEPQQQAVQFFKVQGMELSPAFRPRELQKAFRLLAIKLHPDQTQGSGDQFMELRRAYETLKRLV